MPKIKLTDADVRGLRYARNVEGASLAFLANAYGVSKAQVSRVTRGLQRRAPEVSSHEETPEVGKLSDDEKAHRDWALRYKLIWDDTWHNL